jgi:hypothetical protein
MIYPPDIPIEVCDKFIELAREVKRAGMKHYSADAILHRIRWHFIIEQRRGKFKVNNNWTSNLARWAMTYHQDLAGFFNTRASPHKGVTIDDGSDLQDVRHGSRIVADY